MDKALKCACLLIASYCVWFLGVCPMLAIPARAQILSQIMASAPATNAPVSGMALWFSADCITYTSSVCSTPADGTTNFTWADHSGNANNLTYQAGTCTFNTNQLNSLPAVTLASCRWNLASIIAASNGHALFIVYKTTAATAGYVMGSSTLAGFAYEPSGTGAGQVIDRQNSQNIGTSTNHATSGTWYQENALMQNLASTFIMNFRQSSAVDVTASQNSNNIGANGPSGVGGDLFGTPAQFFSGSIAEIIYYTDPTLTLTQIQQNEAYFRAKYGIS